ncbi:Global transcription factor group E4, putative isoform 4 [Hibiscus syriacus]|uniref:Global transcription factor group E4, putative isoform 4 n=1 Tax=Hibiscus syriacus TaxID=106335 RepID=A0A6A3C8V9_HIBSY|nr:transcription factor GTE4-like [Hibiscus syriacus]KAE8723489.1 Global transcription factor group E4, putative isoform 4 [Hibiscus syriacus]
MATGTIEGEESKNDKFYARKIHSEPQNPTSQQPLATTTTSADDNNSQHQLPLQPSDAVASDDSSSRKRSRQSAKNATNGIATSGYVKYDNLVKIDLNVLSKNEVRVLKRKLATELEEVRDLVKKFEAEESRFNGVYAYSRVSGNENVDRGCGSLVRANSDVGSVGLPSSRSFHGLSVSMAEPDHSNNDDGGGRMGVKNEKRNPKANQYYNNSKFALRKEKLKPIESNKKMKPSGGKSNGGQMRGGITPDKFSSQLFKRCSNLLGKLMKHKFGWVFNKPVDVKGLGLHDYYTIVKCPMDLGTVKTRLNKTWYKSPRAFAKDVRLTFSNAMLYNPKGQDVHIMAENLSQIFEENWAAIELEYNLKRRCERIHDYSSPNPTSRKLPAPVPPQASVPIQTLAPSSLSLEVRTSGRPESMTMPDDPKSRAVDLTPTGKIAVPKKPKAKEPDKRDMTYEEKQRLSVNLQNLPSEELDSIVQIIKKRNPALFQQDDEIEVDIDSFDPETLWELDRFVTNYKKGLGKSKRKVKVPLQANSGDGHNVHETNLEPLAEEVPKVAETEEKIAPTSPVHREKLQNNENGSSSSSSGSGSSSTDSDSDSSSG